MSRLLLKNAVFFACFAVLVGCGGNNRADREAKRATDRQTMQIEDLSNQRTALLAEVERLRASDKQLRTDLKSAQEQLEQARIELTRARNELSALQQRLNANPSNK